MEILGLSSKEAARFKSKYVMSHGCWEWIGGKFDTGYGAFWLRGQNRGAHVVAFIHHNLTSPNGQHVCHTCDNRSCVRPSHLFLGTHRINSDDKVAKQRQARGEGIGSAVLTEDQVRAIRPDPRPNTQIASSLGVDTKTVWLIKNGRTWKHVT